MQVIRRQGSPFMRGSIIFVLLALAASTTAYHFLKQNNAVVTDTLDTVVRGDIRTVISATGTISAVNSVSVSSRVTGLITEVRVTENEHVKAGQVLVVLDDTSLRAQVAQYQAQLANYAANYERSRQLAAMGAQSLQQLDSDRTNYLVAQANYDNFASQLDYYIIKAPIDGVVIGKPTPAGQTVVQGISAAQVLMTIADLSKMQIKVQVDETDIGSVRAGQRVSFTVDAYPDKTFTGTVKSISKDAVTSSNVVYYPVYVDADAGDGLLYPSMTARVTIHTAERDNVLLVPLSALKEEQEAKYVQVMTDGRLEKRPVKIGLANDEQAEILSGLTEGEQVAIPAAKQKTSANTQNQGPPPPI